MLNIVGISKSYGKTEVLKNLNYSFPDGGFYGLIGPNGVGKSTLLGIISGVIKPDSGSVELDGKRLESMKDFRRKVCFVPQDCRLIEDASVRDNLKFFYGAYARENSSVDEDPLVDSFGMRSLMKVTASKLSGGQRRKLAILCNLTDTQSAVLLDEPTGALDIPSKHEIFRIIEDLKNKGKLIIMSSHDQFELKRVDEMVILKNHKLSVPDLQNDSDLIDFN